MKRFLCLIFLLLLSLPLFNQDIEEQVDRIKELPLEDRLSEFQAAIEKEDQPPLHRARFHHELGVVHFIQDDLFQAIEETEKALNLRLQYEEEAGEEVVFSAYNLGSFYHNLEHYDQAFARFQMIVDRAPNSRMGYTLFRLGSLYRDMGEFTLGEKAFEEANQLAPFPEDMEERATLWIEWADLYLKQKNPDAAQKAIPILQEVFPMFVELAKEDDYYASLAALSLNRLGIAYTYAEQFDRALQIYQQAHSYNEQCCRSDDLKASIYTNQGVSFRRSGKLEPALNFHLKALDIRLAETKEGKASINAARAYDNVAGVLMDLGRMEEGLQQIQSALQWALPSFSPDNIADNPEVGLLKASPHKNDLLIYLQDKGRLWQQYANHQQQAAYFQNALHTFQVCDRLIDLIREDHIEQQSKLFWRDQARSMYQAAVQTSWMAGQADMAFYFSEKSRSVLLLDGLRELNAHSRLPDSTQTELSRLAARIKYLEGSIYGASPEASRPLEGRLLLLQEQYRHLRDSLEKVFPDYYRQKYQQDFVSLQDLQNSLQVGEAWVEYFLADQFALALLIDRQSIKMVQLANPEEWEPLIDQFLRNLKNYREPFEPEAALKLYQYLIEPLSLANYTALTLVPDAQLSLIPFEALIRASPQPGSPYSQWAFLLKQFQIHYAFSANYQLFTSADKNQNNGRIFGFAPMGLLAPDFGIDATLELPESRFTLDKIARILPTDTFLGRDANRTSFIESGPEAAVLHLATHAFLNHEQPEFSYFLVAAQEENQRKFFVNDLYDYSFRADLAVLSACETGTGKLFRGEGVASIGRAFAQNGCPNLAISLWPVDDSATGKLLENYYERLKSGVPKAAALYQAKIDYLEQVNNNQLNHPFRWAGFVYYGVDKPLALGKSEWWKRPWIWVLLGAVLVGLFLRLRFKN